MNRVSKRIPSILYLGRRAATTSLERGISGTSQESVSKEVLWQGYWR